jgi:hypothetical protein
MKIKNNNSGFSILIAIFMIGFLLILVIWVFNLMLRDMKDNKWSENYIKAYAGAEWAMELWLLKIKKDWYAIDDDLPKSSSGILSFNPSLKNNDPKISYEMNIATNDYTGKIWTGSTVIIPLFSWTNYIKQPNFTWDPDIIWNIIWKWEWMSWIWDFTPSTPKKYRQNNVSWDITYATESINTFLWRNQINYLMIYNKWNELNYKLEVPNWELFSKPVWSITSSVQVWKFKQNITTNIDNTEFLKMLKYSLYSK